VEPPDGGGGHEGFYTHHVCMDEGVGLSWMTYRLGDDAIRLFPDPGCRGR
jgi:hypothetical protein